MSNFISIMIAFFLFEALPFEEVTLCLDATIIGIKFLQTQHKRNRVNAQQYNMGYTQKLTHASFVTISAVG